MVKRICLFDGGCPRAQFAKGFCEKHYWRLWRHGSTADRPRGRPVADRFWEKVIIAGANDCWEWIGAKDKSGYGRFGRRHPGKRSGAAWIAPRFAWTDKHGPIPPGMFVCHRCDNTGCVNPAHLFLGTNTDNMRDCAAKGRTAKNHGERCGRARLRDADIVTIRKLRAGGVAQKTIASQYNIDPSAISRIVGGKRWSHV